MVQEEVARRKTVVAPSARFPGLSRELIPSLSRGPYSLYFPCVHHIFEAHARRSPHHLAVESDDGQLTYQELDRRANQLGHFLREQGVRRGSHVAICMERAIEMIISVLGVLKAGAAYVPLDPYCPLQRLAWILNDASALLILTQERVAEYLPVYHAPVIYVDSEWEEKIAGMSCEPVASGITSADAAYVIYTSGSTGQPKGILLHHQGLCNLSLASNRLFNLQTESRILQFSSFGFDVSVWEIFMALTTGGTLCLNGPNTLFSIEDLQGRLRRQQITTALISPSVLRLLPAKDLLALRTLIAVGEKCTAENVQRWAAGREFFNGYGPAEATVTVSAYLTDAAEDHPLGPPIGRPLANTELYNLEQNLEPAPIGVRGELCIGGIGLAIGYLNQPALTAEKFAPHPFSRNVGERLYRTGDMVKYSPDGNLEYLGRVDHQIKLRGYRIELEEIESVMMESGLVKDAVALINEEAEGEKRLIAYLVKGDGIKDEGLQRRMKKYLEDRVPGYMIPSAIIEVEKMPLTPNGKVNRQALPRPEYKRPGSDEEFAAPHTEIEGTVAAIWREVLKIGRISIDDNFFDLGGHSLLLAQVYTRLRGTFEQNLTMLDLFKYTSIRALSRYLSRGSVEKHDLSQVQNRARKQKEVRDLQKQRPGRGYQP
jgi:amino acid adenylation domain-containing protein